MSTVNVVQTKTGATFVEHDEQIFELVITEQGLTMKRFTEHEIPPVIWEMLKEVSTVSQVTVAEEAND